MRKTVLLFLVFVLALLGIGLVTVATTSTEIGTHTYGDAHHFLKRQGVWMFLGLTAGFITTFIPFQFWFRARYLVLAVTIGLLVLVLIPSIGLNINGARRWLPIGPFQFQPSEFAKFASVLFIAAMMNNVHRRSQEFFRGFLYPGLALGGMVALVFIEPDFGTTMLLCAVGGLMLFVAGSNVVYVVGASILGFLFFVAMIMQNENRRERIMAWLDPYEHAGNKGLQLVQSMNAFFSGGVDGVGLGASTQKAFYLPEAHTDFIFSILAEEHGLAGSLLVLFLFLGLFICGLIISNRCRDNFGRLLGIGLTFVVTLQALINMGVITGLLPTKGIALPFMSYGGSHILVTGAMIGILLSIARFNEKDERDETSLEGSGDWS